MKQASKHKSSVVFILGNIALGFSGVALILYNIRRFIFNAPAEQGYLLATIALAFIGLITIIIAHCLKNLEMRLPPKE
jgi:hypothetical protein